MWEKFWDPPPLFPKGDGKIYRGGGALGGGKKKNLFYFPGAGKTPGGLRKAAGFKGEKFGKNLGEPKLGTPGFPKEEGNSN